MKTIQEVRTDLAKEEIETFLAACPKCGENPCDCCCSECGNAPGECFCCPKCGENPCDCCHECGNALGACICCGLCGYYECQCLKCPECGTVHHDASDSDPSYFLCTPCAKDISALQNLVEKGYIFSLWRDVYKVRACDSAHHLLSKLSKSGTPDYFTAEYAIRQYRILLEVGGGVVSRVIAAACEEIYKW